MRLSPVIKAIGELDAAADSPRQGAGRARPGVRAEADEISEGSGAGDRLTELLVRVIRTTVPIRHGDQVG